MTFVFVPFTYNIGVIIFQSQHVWVFENVTKTSALEVYLLVGWCLGRISLWPAASRQKDLYHTISRSDKTSRGIFLHYTRRAFWFKGQCVFTGLYNGSYFLLNFPQSLFRGITEGEIKCCVLLVRWSAWCKLLLCPNDVHSLFFISAIIIAMLKVTSLNLSNDV